MTTIYCTSKLKEFLKPVITEEGSVPITEKWNAHLFYLNGRKCIAFLHKETVYAVVLFDILKKDLKKLSELFSEAFISQLYADGLLEKELEYKVREQNGNIYFRTTDNDRSAIGSLNDVIARLKQWETSPEIIEKVKEYVKNYANAIALKSINFKTPKEMMSQIIKNYC